MQGREVESAKDANIREVHDDARMCVPVKSRILGAAGFEHTHETLAFNRAEQAGGAKSGAVPAQFGPEFTEVKRLWPELLAEIRQVIVATAKRGLARRQTQMTVAGLGGL